LKVLIQPLPSLAQSCLFTFLNPVLLTWCCLGSFSC
jgi:hypothetical protein